MLDLYRSMAARGVSGRLELARRLNSSPDDLVSLFTASVVGSARHRQRRPAFHSTGATPAETLDAPVHLPWTGARRRNPTYLFACKCREGLGVPFSYVDRELECLRTPEAAEEPVNLTAALELDLLLATGGERMPILAELKINDDRDAVYGFVQVLAAAAHLVSTAQRACLLANYGDALSLPDAGPFFDVHVILFRDRSHPLRGARVKCLEEATALAAKLGQLAEVAAFVREIRVVDSWLENDRLRFAAASVDPTLGDPLCA
jgi:hypothetical protein